MAAVKVQAAAVGITATLIDAGPLPFAAPGTSTVVVCNLGPTNSVFLGDVHVSSSNGIQLAAGASLVLPGATLQGLYGIAAVAPVTVTVGVF